ncbi:MAG TPA: WD40 repeat domain-containing protein, partial [Thermoanaerobaculia bacterium]|nr:WD40 repeat domain-containing protein [Thermoanaerobaculia bacterium]
VLCSPNAARSRWVNEEIKTFKARGREQVFAVIVDGEPNGSDRPETAGAECFPEALRYRINERREVTAERADPIAGDARKHKDGFDRAMLKTVAGILGVDFAKLVKRDEERRKRRNRIVVGGLSLVLAIVSALGVWGWIERTRAVAQADRAQRQVASNAVSNLLTDDPLKAVLILLTLRGGPDPEGALQAAIELQSKAIPTAVLSVPSVSEAEFSSTGEKVVTATTDGRVQSWNADGTGGPGFLRNVATHERDRYPRLVADAWIHHRPPPVVPLTLLGHAEPVAPPGFHLLEKQRLLDVRGEFVLTTTEKGHEVFLWNTRQKGAPETLEGHVGSIINSASFSPDGQKIVTTSADALAAVWPVRGDESPWILKGHPGDVFHAAFSADGKWVLTLCDGIVRIWPANDRDGPLVLTNHVGGAVEALFSADGRRILTSAGDGTLRVWSADGHGDPVILRGPTNMDQEIQASFSPDGRRVIAPFDDGSVRIWNSSGVGEPIAFGTEPVDTAAFSGDGRRVVTASNDGNVVVWQVDRRIPVPLLTHAGAWNAMFSPDSTCIAGKWADDTVHVWKADGTGSDVVLGKPLNGDQLSSMLLKAVPGNRLRWAGFAFSPDGRRIVTVATGDDVAKIWNSDGTGRPIELKGHSREVFEAVFSPDGKRVVTSSDDGTARIWDAISGKAVLTLAAHKARVSSALFSPNGKSVLTSSDDGTVRVWDVATNRQVALLREENPGSPTVPRMGSQTLHFGDAAHSINRARFSPNGRSVLTASQNGTVQVSLIDWESLLDRIARRTTACLAAADRERYLGQEPARAKKEFEQCEAKYGRTRTSR